MNLRPTLRVMCVLSTGILAALAAGSLLPGSGAVSRAAAAIPELAAIDPAGPAAALPLAGTFAPIIERAAPAVVSITASAVVKAEQPGFPFFGPPEGRRSGTGSGVIITPDGYVLTNHHVVDGAQQIEVTLSDRRTYAAAIVGSDARTDIAVLKLDATNLPALPLGNSDSVRVGDIVLAIGNPFGIGQTVTMGIVGATGRGNLGIEDYEDFIQTDAAINPGNSGGALINTRGQLIGVNTAILSRTGGNNGVGFAVPVNLGHHVMSQIIRHGEVRRGYLGVGIQDLTPPMAKALGAPSASGAVISDVTPGGPAAAAGMRRGDVIQSMNGRTVRDARELRLAVAAIAPGTQVTLGVVRDGEPREIRTRLDQLPEPGARKADVAAGRGSGYGLGIADLTPELARELGVEPGASGVVVTEVQPGSAAAEAGLRRGDVILEANRRAVANHQEFREAVRAAAGEPLLALISRDGRTFYAVLTAR